MATLVLLLPLPIVEAGSFWVAQDVLGTYCVSQASIILVIPHSSRAGFLSVEIPGVLDRTHLF